MVRATLPDVCKTPAAKNAPLPYPNIAFSKDLAKGTNTVFADGGQSCAILGSEFSCSTGDEAGSGGGVSSGTFMDRATWLSWSPDVFLEGAPACRLSDKMLMNDCNTASLGGLCQESLSNDELMDKLCDYACECKGAVNLQRCVASKIERDNYNGAYPADQAQVWREVSFRNAGADGFQMIMNRAGTAPTSNPITPGGGIRPDCVLTDGAGQVSKIVEMKFPGDTLRPSQVPGGAYSTAADGLGADYEVIEVEDDCDCWNNGSGQPVPVALPLPATEEESSLKDYMLGGAVVVGAGLLTFACFASGVCEAAIAAAAAAAGITALTTAAAN